MVGNTEDFMSLSIRHCNGPYTPAPPNKSTLDVIDETCLIGQHIISTISVPL